MTNPQQLKERIYALNPELKALTMGCEVRFCERERSGTKREDIIFDPVIFLGYETDFENIINKEVFYYLKKDSLGRWDKSVFYSDCIVEILGHPIHLEHVLRAMKLTGHEWEKITVKGNIMNFSIPKSESVTTIEEGVGINNEQYGSVTNYEWWSVDYDLTKTFDQNIAENEELVTFLLNIIK